MAYQISLIEESLLSDSIALLRANEPTAGYYGCFSGGKDSIVIKQLAIEAGVSVKWHYNKTTIDPPELVRYIREYHPDVVFIPPKHGNFFRRMEKKGFPTRRNRWCCSEYKEGNNPPGITMVMGIRSEESAARAKRWSDVTVHHKSKGLVVSPILHWASDEIWWFIRDRQLPYCCLYDEGFHRLGCIGCPMARLAARKAEFVRWPRYERLWKRSFRRIWDRRTGTLQRDGRPWFGDVYFSGWEEMWNWWLSDSCLPVRDDRQLVLAR